MSEKTILDGKSEQPFGDIPLNSGGAAASAATLNRRVESSTKSGQREAESRSRRSLEEAAGAIAEAYERGSASAERQLALLVDLGYRFKELGKLMDASRRSLTRWRGGESIKGIEAAERVNDLFSIVAFMLRNGTLSPEDVVTWTRSRLPSLNGQRPLELLRQDGGWHAVRAAAELLFNPELGQASVSDLLASLNEGP